MHGAVRKGVGVGRSGGAAGAGGGRSESIIHPDQATTSFDSGQAGKQVVLSFPSGLLKWAS